MNILIVGAGPTGLTTALELARRGVTPTIVDVKEKQSTRSRAVGILPKTIETLNRTGVGDKMLEAGVKIKRVSMYRDGNQLIDLDIPESMDAGEFITGLPQDETETIMSDTLSEFGVSVQYGREVTNVKTADNSATVTYADGKQETYDWVVGSDGVRSTVRESLAIPFAGYDLDEVWSIADLQLPPDEYDMNKISAWMVAAADENNRDALVLFPMTHNRVRLVSSTPNSVKALPLDLGIKEILRTGTFKISVRQAQTYVKGRVVLAGDAAHAHSPVGGRGMNLGIDDGQALAEALFSGDVETYGEERRKKARRVIDGTEQARKLIQSNSPLAGPALQVAGWLIHTVPFIRKAFFQRVVKL